MKKQIALIILSIFSISCLFSAEIQWQGNTSSNWHTASNWQGGVVPGTNDVAVFNFYSSNNAVINSNVSVSGIRIETGYFGTISHIGGSISVGTTGFVQQGGVFTGGASVMTVSGNFILSAGVFTAPSTSLTLSSAIVTVSGGTFNHNNGTVYKTGSYSTWSWNQPLNNLDINTMGSFTTYGVKALGNVYARGWNAHIGDLTVEGNYSIYFSSQSSCNGKVIFSGSNNQTLSAPNGTGCISGVEVNKTSGTLTVSNTIIVQLDWTNISDGTQVDVSNATPNFTFENDVTSNGMIFNNIVVNCQGWFNAVDTMRINGLAKFQHFNSVNGVIEASGNVQFLNPTQSVSTATLFFVGSNNQTLSANGSYGVFSKVLINKTGGSLTIDDTIKLSLGLEWISGSVNSSTSTVVFYGGSQTIDAEGINFNNVELNTQGNITLARPLKVDGSLTVTAINLIEGERVEVKGNLTYSDDFFWGNGVETYLIGSNNQNLSFLGTSGLKKTLYIDKPAGEVVLTSNTSWASSLQNVFLINGTFNLNGKNLTVGGTIKNSGTIKLIGSEVVTLGGLDQSGQGTVTYTGTGTYSQLALGDEYYHLNIAGNATQDAPLTVRGNLNITGSLNSNGQSLFVGGNFINSGTYTSGNNSVYLIGKDQTITGSNLFYNLFKRNNQTSSITFTAGTTQSISNKLELVGSLGNLLSLNSSTPGTAWSINYTGTQTQLGYLNISDSSSVTTLDAKNTSVNGGNNTNWVFNGVNLLAWTGAVNNNFSNAGNWVGNVAPTANDVVEFLSGSSAINMDIDANVSGISLGGSFSGSFNMAANKSLTIGYNGITINSGTFTANTKSIITTGNLLINGGTLNGATADIEIVGNVEITGGTFNSSTKTLKVGGNWTKTSGTFEALGSVTFNGFGGQIINTGGIGTDSDFKDVTISFGTVAIASPIQIVGALTINSAQLKNQSQIYLTKDLTNNSGYINDSSGATWILNGTSAQNIKVQNHKIANIQISNTNDTIAFTDELKATNLTASAGTKITLEKDKFFTFTNLNLIGTQSAPIQLRSSIAQQSANVIVNGTQSIAYTDVRGIDGRYGSVLNGTNNCVDLGYNVNWTFPNNSGKPQITFTPSKDIFEGSVSVTLSSTGTAPVIYYTLDGSTPTTGSTVYSSAINLTATTTIKAIAVDGANTSIVFSKVYQAVQSAINDGLVYPVKSYGLNALIYLGDSRRFEGEAWHVGPDGIMNTSDDYRVPEFDKHIVWSCTQGTIQRIEGTGGAIFTDDGLTTSYTVTLTLGPKSFTGCNNSTPVIESSRDFSALHIPDNSNSPVWLTMEHEAFQFDTTYSPVSLPSSCPPVILSVVRQANLYNLVPFGFGVSGRLNNLMEAKVINTNRINILFFNNQQAGWFPFDNDNTGKYFRAGGDTGYAERILNNSTLNGIKYTSANGTVYEFKKAIGTNYYLLTKIIYPGGCEITYEYVSDSLLIITDGSGNKYEIHADSIINGVRQISSIVVRPTGTNEIKSWEYLYDLNGALTSESYYNVGQLPLYLTNYFNTDIYGNPIYWMDPFGNMHYVEYDDNWRVKKYTMPDNTIIENQYSGRNGTYTINKTSNRGGRFGCIRNQTPNRVLTTRYEYIGYFIYLLTHNSRGYVTDLSWQTPQNYPYYTVNRYSYDLYNNLTDLFYDVFGANSFYDFELSPNGFVLSEIRPDGTEHKYFYAMSGKLLKEEVYNLNQALINTINYSFELSGELKTVFDIFGNQFTMTYDINGNVIDQQTALNYNNSYAYSNVWGYHGAYDFNQAIYQFNNYPNTNARNAFDITGYIKAGRSSIVQKIDTRGAWYKFTVDSLSSATFNVKSLWYKQHAYRYDSFEIYNNNLTILAFNKNNDYFGDGNMFNPLHQQISELFLSPGTYYVYVRSSEYQLMEFSFNIQYQENKPPISENETIQVYEENLAPFYVKSKDPETQPLTYIITQQPSSGTLYVFNQYNAFNQNTFGYQSNVDFFGQDSFKYKAFDGMLYGPETTVTINVNNVNDAPVSVNDILTFDGNFIAFNPLLNDTDVDGDTLKIVGVIGGTKGHYTYTNNSIQYTANSGFSGFDVLNYYIQDIHNLSAFFVGTIYLHKNTVPPTAVNDNISIQEDHIVTINPTNNDFDSDGNEINVTSFTNVAHGSLVKLQNAFIYTPALNYFGTDTFTYTISDGFNGYSTATVNITISPVNDNPIATLDTIVTYINTPVQFDPIANDSDVEGSTLTLKKVLSFSSGFPYILQNNTVAFSTYLDFTGEVNGFYEVSDGELSSFGQIKIKVLTRINPVADSKTTNEDTTITFNPLVNDIAPVGYSLILDSVQITSAQPKGTVVKNGNDIIYTPSLNKFGVETLSYVAKISLGYYETGVITIIITSVNDDAPILVDDSISTIEDTQVFVYPLTNDIDPDGDTLSIMSVSNGGKGVATFSGNKVTYFPNKDMNGADTFTYTVSDNNGNIVTGNINVLIAAVNDKPIAVADVVSVNEDAAITFNPILNDTDAENDTISLISVTNGSKGVATFSGSDVTYTPNSNAYGVDYLNYTISENAELTDTGTITINISPINDAPIAVNDTVLVRSNTSVTFQPIANDLNVDLDLDQLTLTNISTPVHGVATIINNSVQYTPVANFYGSDVFTYVISDNIGLTSMGTVSVTVHFGDIPSVLSQFTFSCLRNHSISFDLRSHVQDESPSTLVFDLVNPNNIPNLSLTTEGFTITDVGNQFGVLEFSIKITDDYSNVVTTTFKVNVVDTMLNGNEIVRLNHSGIYISQANTNNAPFTRLRDMLLSTSGHNEEWLEDVYDKSQLITYYGVKNLSDLPNEVLVTITPDESFISQNIIKAGIGLLDNKEKFTSLYETTDKTFTGQQNQYVMSLQSQTVLVNSTLFSQGLNRIVLYTELQNGVKTFYNGDSTNISVTPYIKSTYDNLRTPTVLFEDGVMKYQYNYLTGFENGLFIDTLPPLIINDQVLMGNNQVVLTGSLKDEVGVASISTVLLFKNGNNEFEVMNPILYKTDVYLSSGGFTVVFQDANQQSMGISSLPLGTTLKATINATDYLGHSTSNSFEFDYYPSDKVVHIDTFTASQSNILGMVNIAYQVSILANVFEIENISLNGTDLGNTSSNLLSLPIVNGKNFFTLNVKAHLIALPSVHVSISNTISYSEVPVISIQNLQVSGSESTTFQKISTSSSTGRTVTFDIYNPKSIFLNVKVTITDFLTYETHTLSVIEYESGKYKVNSDFALMPTMYEIKVSAVTSDSSSIDFKNKTFQNGSNYVTSSGSLNSLNPPTISIHGSNSFTVYFNGKQVTDGHTLDISYAGQNDITIGGNSYNVSSTTQSNYPGADFDGNNSSSGGYNPNNKAFEVNFPVRPCDQYPNPLVNSNNQYIKGLVSSKIQSIIVVNLTNGIKKEIAASIISKSNEQNEFRADLSFLVPGLNNLIIKGKRFDAQGKVLPDITLPYNIVLDTKSPEISINFGGVYANQTVVNFVGYHSFYNSLTVDGTEYQQNKYELTFDVTDNEFLGKDLEAIKKKLEIRLGQNLLVENDLDKLELTLSPDNKHLHGRIKNNEKISYLDTSGFSNNSNLFIVRVSLNDISGNQGIQNKRFTIYQGPEYNSVMVKFYPKPLKIIVSDKKVWEDVDRLALVIRDSYSYYNDYRSQIDVVFVNVRKAEEDDKYIFYIDGSNPILFNLGYHYENDYTRGFVTAGAIEQLTYVNSLHYNYSFLSYVDLDGSGYNYIGLGEDNKSMQIDLMDPNFFEQNIINSDRFKKEIVVNLGYQERETFIYPTKNDVVKHNIYYVQEKDDNENKDNIEVNKPIGTTTFDRNLFIRTEFSNLDHTITSIATWSVNQITFNGNVGIKYPMPPYPYYHISEHGYKLSDLENALVIYTGGLEPDFNNQNTIDPLIYTRKFGLSALDGNFSMKAVFVDDSSNLHYSLNYSSDFEIDDIVDAHIHDYGSSEIYDKPVVLGMQNIELPAITYMGETYPVTLQVEVGDYDNNKETSYDLYVKSYAIHSTLNEILHQNRVDNPYYSNNYPNSEYRIIQLNGVDENPRPVTVASGNNHQIYHMKGKQKSYSDYNSFFVVTPSYYKFFFGEELATADDNKYFPAYPGATVTLSETKNQVSATVNGVKFVEENTSDILDITSGTNYKVMVYGVSYGSISIKSYDENFNLLESYSGDYNGKFRFVSNLKDKQGSNNNETINSILAKDKGHVTIEIGDYLNVYLVNDDETPVNEFEAITGITPAIGAGYTSSEGVDIFGGANTVLAHNRQFILSQTDLSVRGKTQNLSFTRTYRSGSSINCGIGRGWSHNFNQYFLPLENGNYEWHQGNGRYDEITLANPPAGFYCKFTLKDVGTENERIEVAFADGSVHAYSYFGNKYKLTKITDRNDNIITIVWDGIYFIATLDNGQFLALYPTSSENTNILTDGNREVEFEGNDNFLVVDTKEMGFTYRYSYNSSRLITGINKNSASVLGIVYENSSSDYYKVKSQSFRGITYQFTQSFGGAITETLSAPGESEIKTEYEMASTDITNPLSRFLKSVKFQDQTKKITYKDFKTEIMQVGEVTDRKGIKTQTTYKSGGNVFNKGLVEKVEVFKSPDDTNPLTPNSVTQSFQYTTKNIHNNDIYFVSRSTDARINSSRFAYDEKGNQTSSIVESDDGDLETKYKYDDFGRMIGSVAPNGATTVYLYYDYLEANKLLTSASGWLRRTISDSKKRTADLNYATQLLAMDNDTARKNPNLQVVDFAYDIFGNLATTVDPQGRASSSEFDLSRRLIKTSGPDTNNHGRVTTKYLYEGKQAGGSDKGWASWTTCTTEIPYPQIASSSSASIDWGKQSTITSRFFDDHCRLLKVITGTQVSENILDGFGRTKASVVRGSNGAPDQITTFKFDAFSNIETVISGDDDTDPNNSLSSNYDIATTYRFERDESDNVTKTFRNNQKITTTTLDGFDRAVASANFTSYTGSSVKLDSGSNVTEARAGAIDSDGIITQTFSHQNMLVDKLGVTVETTDNLRKNELGITEPAIFGFSYNIRENEVKYYNPNFIKGGSSDSGGVSGNQITAKKSKNEKDSDTLDDQATTTITTDNLIETTVYPDKTKIIKEFNNDGTLKHITKDESKVLGTEGEIQKRRTRFEYDSSGFLVKDIVQKASLTDFIDPTGGEIISQNTYINDGIGRPILITDARGNQTKNDFNELGQLIYVTTGFGSTNAITKGMTYYANGALKSETQGNQTTSYEYNAKGALTKTTYIQNAKTEVEENTYNNKGLLKIKTLRHDVNQPAVTLTYIYQYELDLDDTGSDETDFLVQIKTDNKILREFADFEFGQAKTVIEHNRFFEDESIDTSGDVITTYTFNSNRQAITESTVIKDLNGISQSKTITRHYNKAGDLESLKYPTLISGNLRYQYDTSNRLVAIKNNINNNPIKEFKYFGLGKLASSSEGNGNLVQRFTYDKQDWLKGITGDGGKFNAGSFAFVRENNGIKKTVTYGVNGASEKADHYKYDEHNRLISAGYDGKLFGQDIFNLDSLDNILTGKIDGNNVTNVIKDSVRIDTSNGVTFNFDTRGNTIEDDKYYYEWDTFDRIKTITNKTILSSWFKIEYLYDASGRRVQKIVDGSQGFWYIFDGYQMIEERTYTSANATTNLRRQVVYGTAINEPVYVYDASTSSNYYLLKNDQNTVLAVYNANSAQGAAPNEQYEYSSYGITNILDGAGVLKTFDHDLNVVTPEIKKIKSDFANPFGYQGMWRDEHTGLYHTHYRLYDPQHVRWLTPDPAGYRDGQNLYRFYAGPNGVDVLGLDEESVRHAVTSAIATKGKVLSRLARIKAGDAEALTAEYIAQTQSMYKGYLNQRNMANIEIKDYMQTASYFTTSPYDWYDVASSKLGEIGEIGQISARSELSHAHEMNELISSNIETISNLHTAAQYSGYAGNAILIGTGVGGLAVAGRALAMEVGTTQAIRTLGTKVIAGAAAFTAVDYGAQALATDEAKPFVSAELNVLAGLLVLKCFSMAKDETHLFRGTTEGYPGSPQLQKLEITPTSTDPLIATLFAIESSRFGEAVVLVANSSKLPKIPGNVLANLEAEVGVNMSPTAFANQAKAISLKTSRMILEKLGFKLPNQIANKADLDLALKNATKLTKKQIKAYIKSLESN